MTLMQMPGCKYHVIREDKATWTSLLIPQDSSATIAHINALATWGQLLLPASRQSHGTVFISYPQAGKASMSGFCPGPRLVKISSERISCGKRL